MSESPSPGAPEARHEDVVLRLILAGTATETGTDFFRALVRNVALALGTAGAWVTEYIPGRERMRSIAFWMNGRFIDHYEYDLRGTPCNEVIKSCGLVHISDSLQERFPTDPDLTPMGAISYLGVPLLEANGELLGHLAAQDTKPMPYNSRLVTVFEIFAARAAAEYRRVLAERDVRAREEQLSRLIETAMDAVLILDRGLSITRSNPAAEKAFGSGSHGLTGRDLRDFLEPASVIELINQLETIDARPERERGVWLPRALQARRGDGAPFPAEATLSSFDSAGRRHYSLILRNVNERLEAERQLKLLSEQTEYLREAVRDLPGTGQILGESRSMRELLAPLAKVASTDATVLILGETGTGKELIARSIHTSSRRGDKPLVRVNCAAIPGTLIESELFGHEKGAFTGAAGRREGRFALADGGTIFLDEVGELPLDLQAKLLRVLQEGEFEPLGSSRTRKVDVRIVAATNRDLSEMVSSGGFREDLYYRLNAFPLRVPPLRERGDDVVLLARAFAEQYAKRMGRRSMSIRADDIWRLKAYSWPGNVRELQNVVERGIILSTDDHIALSRAMPELSSVPAPAGETDASGQAGESPRILRAAELQRFERENIIRALEETGWKVAGKGGAADLLGCPPSTLASRMKSLGIRRPR